MAKLFKKYPWQGLILLQALIGICAGFFAMGLIGTDVSAAEDTYKSRLKTWIEQAETGAVTLDVDGQSFTIAYADFDVKVDIDKTSNELLKAIPQNGMDQFFGTKKTDETMMPFFTFNSGKLRKILEERFSVYEKSPVPEIYRIKDGMLVRTAGEPGIKIDYELFENVLAQKILSLEQGPCIIDTKTSPIFAKISTENVYSEPFEYVVSHARVSLEKGYADSIIAELDPHQGAIFNHNSEISLKQLIDFSKFSGDVGKNILDRIATALFQTAIQLDGVKVLNRKPAAQPVSYTEPGLEAVISGEGADLLMKNETGKPLMLLYEISTDTLDLYFASTSELLRGEIVVEKKDQVPPPVITSVNKTLSANETRIVSEGIPGFTAYVSRVMGDSRVELYRDKYQPVSKIVETGDRPIVTNSK